MRDWPSDRAVRSRWRCATRAHLGTIALVNTKAKLDDGAEEDPRLLWRYGDAWRDLTEEVRNQVVTIVTRAEQLAC